jgi:hypothetical protein
MGLRNAFKVPIEESTLFAVSTVQLLARIPGDKPENDQYRLAISGKHLNGNIHMRVGSGAEATLEAPYVGLPRSNILVFDVAAKNLDPVVQASGDAGATALVWGQKMKPDGRTPDGPVYCQTVVAIPKDAKAALATPNTPDISLDPSSPAVYKGQTPVVIASGPKVKFVQVLNGVLFGTTPLHYKWADPDKDKLLVILNKDSTKDAGRQTLEFLLTTGDSQYVPLQVLDSPSAADQGGSSQKSQ